MTLVFYAGGAVQPPAIVSDTAEVSLLGEPVFSNPDYFFFINIPSAGLDRVIVSNQKVKTAGWVNGG